MLDLEAFERVVLLLLLLLFRSHFSCTKMFGILANSFSISISMERIQMEWRLYVFFLQPE